MPLIQQPVLALARSNVSGAQELVLWLRHENHRQRPVCDIIACDEAPRCCAGLCKIVWLPVPASMDQELSMNLQH